MIRFLSLLFVVASACTFTAPAIPSPPADATYKLYTPELSQCTAWAADSHYLVTAGHCCPDEGDYYFLQPGKTWGTAERVIAKEMDYLGKDPVDVCLLRSSAPLPSYLPLAHRMPKYGEPVSFAGYPKGKWTFSTGMYLGDVDGPLDQWNNYTATAPCDHGASGSAMYSSEGVYGVLVRIMVVDNETVLPGDMGCVASPLGQILDILKYRSL